MNEKTLLATSSPHPPLLFARAHNNDILAPKTQYLKEIIVTVE